MADRVPGFNTLAIHAGAQPDPATGARATPIYQTTSFVFDDVDHAASLFGLQAFGNIYTRIGNPTCAVLEERVAALEGGTAALAVASGHAAEFLTFHALLQPGDEFIASKKLYGGSINQFNHSYKSFGWNVVWADPDDLSSFEKALTPKTKAIFVESIANPGGVIVDIAAISAIAKRANIPLIVDNTMATPYLWRPIEHGADIVIHSATKFLGGHGTTIAGIVVDAGTFDFGAHGDRFPGFVEPDPSYHGLKYWEALGPGAYAAKLRVQLLRDTGAAISPFNSFLILQGIETLSLRMERHVANAQALAEWLESRDEVAKVYYPGLPSSPYYEAAKKYLPKGAGAIVSFELHGGIEAGRAFVDGTELFSQLVNIGDVRSLIVHPASTTHSQLTPEEQLASGVTPGLVRLSVGLEHVDDLRADLEAGLRAAKAYQ